MSSLMLPRSWRQQPPSSCPINKSHPLMQGAQAIISGASDINLVSGIPLVKSGSNFTKILSHAGIGNNFNYDYYLETETLQAIGTGPFVEFWYGYANVVTGQNVQAPSYLTGSANNLIGLVQSNCGSNTTYDINNVQSNNWGSWLDYNAKTGVIASNSLTSANWNKTLCLSVRYATGMDIYQDGIYQGTISGSSPNLAATTFIIGSFVEFISFWSSTNTTILAGRINNYWSPAQIASFSQNPWQIFQYPARRIWVSAPAGSVSFTPTGVSATATAGTFTPKVAITAAGAAATGAAGSFIPAVSWTASGVTATGAAGSFAASATATITPTGVSAAGTAGSFTTAITVTGAGVAATGTAGAFAPAISLTAAGAAATGAAGSFTPSVATAGAGVSAIGTAGNFSVQAGGQHQRQRGRRCRCWRRRVIRSISLHYGGRGRRNVSRWVVCFLYLRSGRWSIGVGSRR